MGDRLLQSDFLLCIWLTVLQSFLPGKQGNSQWVNKASQPLQTTHFKIIMSSIGMMQQSFKWRAMQVPGTYVNPFGSGKEEPTSWTVMRGPTFYVMFMTLFWRHSMTAKPEVRCRGGSHSEEVCHPRRTKLSGQCQFQPGFVWKKVYLNQEFTFKAQVNIAKLKWTHPDSSLTGYVGFILRRTAVATVSCSTVEGTMRVLCIYCKHSSLSAFCHSSVWVPS